MQLFSPTLSSPSLYLPGQGRAGRGMEKGPLERHSRWVGLPSGQLRRACRTGAEDQRLLSAVWQTRRCRARTGRPWSLLMVHRFAPRASPSALPLTACRCTSRSTMTPCCMGRRQEGSSLTRHHARKRHRSSAPTGSGQHPAGPGITAGRSGGRWVAELGGQLVITLLECDATGVPRCNTSSTGLGMVPGLQAPTKPTETRCFGTQPCTVSRPSTHALKRFTR